MSGNELKQQKIQELLMLAEDKKTVNPPCRDIDVQNLLIKFFSLWLRSNQKHFKEYMKQNYVALTYSEIDKLECYLVQARKYLVDICCLFAGIYQSYGGERYYYGEDQKYRDILVNACLKRYPWLSVKYLDESLWQICRLCNW